MSLAKKREKMEKMKGKGDTIYFWNFICLKLHTYILYIFIQTVQHYNSILALQYYCLLIGHHIKLWKLIFFVLIISQ